VYVRVVVVIDDGLQDLKELKASLACHRRG
jgi:hypothetical protein